MSYMGVMLDIKLCTILSFNSKSIKTWFLDLARLVEIVCMDVH